MGGKPGAPPVTTTPAGTAAKFYASLRLQYRQISTTKSKVLDVLSNEMIEQVTATNVRVKVIKNKVAPPFKQAVVRVRFGRGFDNFWTALQVLIAHGHMVYSSGYFYFERSPELVHPDMKIGTTKTQRPYIQGEQTIFEFADQHPEWRSAVIRKAEQVVATMGRTALDAITPTTGEEPDGGQQDDAEPDPEAVVAALTEQFEQVTEAESAAAREGVTTDTLDPQTLPPLVPSEQGPGRVQFVDPAAKYATASA